MPTEAKERMVEELTEVLSAAPSAIVADYRGLTVADISAVRRSLRERGVTYRVVKNRLARIAADRAGVAELSPLLEGPSALAVSSGDEAALAKAFVDAVRPYRTIAVRGGVVRGRRIDAEGVTRLATLPSRETLLAQLAGAMAAPLGTMAGLFSAPIRNLGSGLQQVADQRGAGENA